MARLFIFGIGGTGSRVIRSLTMLFGAGVELPGITEVVPIIIDPDGANGDLNRTTDLIRNYIQIRQESGGSDGFFRQKISTLNELTDNNQATTRVFDDYKFDLEGVQDAKFRDFIGYDQLDDKTKDFISLLFSEDNLNANMDVGFKGNPNIGSVVLNQFHYSKEFEKFASSFDQDDRIFIISSIFGGTGAAGFPLLLKNIRHPNKDWQNHFALQNSRIGAITVLPYFGIEPDENSKIEKATFISKTKAALSYYRRSVSGNNSLNALYYIGDRVTKDYENREGASEQRNRAHFVELASALAVQDFCSIPDSQMQIVDGKAGRTIYKEYGIKENDVETILFEHIADKSRSILFKPLTQFYLMSLYLKNRISDTVGIRPWNNAENPKIDDSFLTGKFYNNLVNFTGVFFEWLAELASNRRAFVPFQEPNSDDLRAIIKGQSPKSGKINYNSIDHYLNRRGIKPKTGNRAEKLLTLFNKATSQMISEKFNG